MHKKRKNLPIYIFILIIILILLVGIEKSRLTVWHIIKPAAKVFILSNQSLNDYWLSIKSINQLSKENNELRQENARLLKQQVDVDTLKFENSKLQQMLNFNTQRSNLVIRNGQVIGRPSFGSLLSIVIDFGSNSDVKVGNLVVSDGFLVGVVTSVSSKTSEVGLITGNSVKVAAILENSRGLGILSGGNNGIIIENISKDNKISQDESVVSAGINTNTKPGIPIGTVTKILSEESDIYQSVSVKSPIDFNKIEFISVIL